MPDSKQDELIARAVAGDQAALSELLFDHYGPLAGLIGQQLPDNIRGSVDVDDLVQEVHVEVFRSMHRFKPQGENSFFRWIAEIARMRVIDRVRAEQRAKRPDPRLRVTSPPPGGDATTTLLHLVAVDESTPSRIVRRDDRERTLHAALATLKAEYREAITLRYIEALPPAQIAERMGKTEHAVHMLVNRGLKKLRKALGSASQHFTRTD